MCIIFVLVRSQIEFLFIDALTPMEQQKGDFMMKLWVATFAYGYQYYIKLEILNSNFSNVSRVAIMCASLLFTVVGVAKLQFLGNLEKTF